VSQRFDVRSFLAGDVAGAAALLAARHAAQRQVWLALNPAYEDPAQTEPLIRELLEREHASGTVAVSDGAPVAYVIGTRKSDDTWGAHVWVEDAGSAASSADALRLAYADAAAAWVEDGRTRHYVVAPATDRQLVDAWFRLGFGLQHVHALQPAPGSDFQPVERPGLTLRGAEERDIEALVALDPILHEDSARSPIFSSVPVPTPAESRAEIIDDIENPIFTPIVAEHDGRVVATATACSLEISNTITAMMRPVRAGFLGYAAAAPDARGLGAGRALADAVLAFARAPRRTRAGTQALVERRFRLEGVAAQYLALYEGALAA